MAPIVLMRLLVCAVPLVSDTVGPFGPGFGDRPSAAWQAGHALFMLLVSISWALGLFLGPFLLLPPAHHLAVQAASLAVLMLRHNRAGARRGLLRGGVVGLRGAWRAECLGRLQGVTPLPIQCSSCHHAPACEGFLAQHPGNGAVVDVTDAALRAVVTAAVPAAGLQLEELGDAAGPAARCVAGVAAMQVSLGLVLPTILAWQLQSRMASSIAAQAAARRDAAMVAQVRGSQVGAWGVTAQPCSCLGQADMHIASAHCEVPTPPPSPCPACCSMPSCATPWQPPPSTLAPSCSWWLAARCSPGWWR